MTGTRLQKWIKKVFPTIVVASGGRSKGSVNTNLDQMTEKQRLIELARAAFKFKVLPERR